MRPGVSTRTNLTDQRAAPLELGCIALNVAPRREAVPSAAIVCGSCVGLCARAHNTQFHPPGALAPCAEAAPEAWHSSSFAGTGATRLRRAVSRLLLLPHQYQHSRRRSGSRLMTLRYLKRWVQRKSSRLVRQLMWRWCQSTMNSSSIVECRIGSANSSHATQNLSPIGAGIHIPKLVSHR